MLWKAYIRRAHFIDFYCKLEYYESLELYGECSRKFAKLTKFFAKYIVFVVTIGQLGFVLSYTALTVFLFYRFTNVYMIISAIFVFPSTLFAIRTIGSLMMTSFYYVFIISLYLKLRFRQIYNSLKNFNGKGNHHDKLIFEN